MSSTPRYGGPQTPVHARRRIGSHRVHKQRSVFIEALNFSGYQIVGDTGYNIVKLSWDGRKVSFLSYDSFDDDPHPALWMSIRVYLPKANYQIQSYEGSANPPILHRKDCFVKHDYPYWQRFRDLSIQEENENLLSQPGIGYKRAWNQLLEERRLKIINHRLEKLI
jgi:DNA phosphorothioation-associated putative methyltransferase